MSATNFIRTQSRKTTKISACFVFWAHRGEEEEKEENALFHAASLRILLWIHSLSLLVRFSNPNHLLFSFDFATNFQFFLIGHRWFCFCGLLFWEDWRKSFFFFFSALERCFPLVSIRISVLFRENSVIFIFRVKGLGNLGFCWLRYVGGVMGWVNFGALGRQF